MVEKNKFKADLKKLGLKKGMNLLVHSSLRRLGKVKGGAEAVIDAILDCIGPSGTLMMPTHTWNTVWKGQPVFDVNKTPSHVGYLTEVFRKRSGVIRSLHPKHSIAALGPKADFFTKSQLKASTPCPKESPYGRILRDKNGYILMLGVDLEYNTSFHALEEEHGVKNLLTKNKQEFYVIDQDGKMHTKMHYQHADGFARFFRDMEHLLREKGALVSGQTGKGISRLINGIKMRKVVLNILKTQPELMIYPLGKKKLK